MHKTVLLYPSEAILRTLLNMHSCWIYFAKSRSFDFGLCSCNVLLYHDRGITGTALGTGHFGCQAKKKKKQIQKHAIRWNFLLQSVTFLWSEKSICRRTLVLVNVKTLPEWERLTKCRLGWNKDRGAECAVVLGAAAFPGVPHLGFTYYCKLPLRWFLLILEIHRWHLILLQSWSAFRSLYIRSCKGF